MVHTAKRQLVHERIFEALREIGVLLCAFAPLDFALGGSPMTGAWRMLVQFVGVGFLLFGLGVYLEWRQHGAG